MDIKPLRPLNSGKNKKVNSLLSIPLLAATILLITYLIVPQRGWWFAEKEVNNSFFITGAFFFIMLIRSAVQKPYSLELMHWIFCYFFFYFAAIIQFRIYYFPLEMEPSNAETIQANSFFLLWGGCFLLGSLFAKYVKGIKGRVATGFKGDVLKVFAIIAFFATLYMVVVGGSGLFNRVQIFEAFAENMDQSSWLLVLNGIRAFITFNVIFNQVRYRQEKKGQMYLIFSVICLLICCFPTGLARFQMAAIYIGLMIFFLPQLRRGVKFTYLFIFGLIVLFPFVDAFRYQDFFKVNILSAFRNVFQNMAYSYTEGHYDAFSIMVYATRVVEEEGLFWGRMLLGAIFFFIPRRIWPNKPIGTGNLLMEKAGVGISNVSAPLSAEAFLNFGYIGIILGAVLTGWIVKKIDMAYWQREETEEIAGLENREWSYLSILYPVLLSLFFFLIRGDLMSTFSNMMAFVVVGYMMFRFAGRFKDKE